MIRLRNPLLSGLLLSVLLSALAGANRYGLSLPILGDLLETLERRAEDLRFVIRGPLEPGPETVLVVFDDKSYAADPTIFERRAGWTRVIDAVGRADPKVIGVDSFFSKPERLLPENLQKALDDFFSSRAVSGDEAEGVAGDGPLDLLRRIWKETQGDQRLAGTIAGVGNVILAMHLGNKGNVGDHAADGEILSKGRFGQSVPGLYKPAQMESAMASLPAFCRAARGLGVVTVFEDRTRTVREMKLVMGFAGGLYTSLAAQLVAGYRGLGRGRLAYLGIDHSVHIGGQAIKLNRRDGFYLNFRGPAGTFETISMSDLLSGRVSEKELSGRIVLLGITQFGHDSARTPFQTTFPAVELQATAVDNLLRGDFIVRSPPWLDALVCLALGLLISALFWPRLSLAPWLRVSGSGAGLIVYLVVSQYFFAAKNTWLAAAAPGGVFISVLLVCLALSYIGEGAQRRKLRRAFAHYLSDEVIRGLLASPGALSLGGERKLLTVLFSDIRGFTNISEQIPPEELTALLNDYFTPMTRAVLASGGLLDKYIGDALMAVFGAPLPQPDHTARALRCALLMHAELEKIRPLFAGKGLDLDIGVGINSGEMVVGNMGSAERFDYTVVGDAVNLSSRLEGLTRRYGVFCILGERARKLAGEGFEFREIDRVQVKGKSLAVSVFELLSGEDYTIARYRDLSRFQAALAAFRKGEFEKARREFGVFHEANPQDRVTALYLERLAGQGDGPSDDWNPVAVLQSK